MQEFGNANAPATYKSPDGFKLGSWQSDQMQAYKNGKLDKDIIMKLEDIGFIWDKFEEAWERGYQETLKYKQEFGNANTPATYKTPDGFNLGWWQGTQKGYYNNRKLNNEKIKRLEDIGFIWNPLDKAWEKGYQESVKYKQQHGDANAPDKYKTPDGFNLGKWQSHQGSAYKKGELDKDRIKKLEDIGFIWDILGEAWERGYQESIKYKQEFGDINAPKRYKTPNYFNLGSWQQNQKTNYNKGKLDNGRIKRLEDIGFIWDILDGAWKKGYEETLKYKKEFGNANTPNRYKTPEGFTLGRWHVTQKANYKRGILDKEKIKKLEKIA